jgi:hypothetical protein
VGAVQTAAPKVCQPRARRACSGEPVQIDGSDHHWFEDRAPACTLLVYVDDATSRLMHLLHGDRGDLQLFQGDARVPRKTWQAGGILQRLRQRVLYVKSARRRRAAIQLASRETA